ncbi:maltooligosyl trehalose hydrolase [Pedobacter westerhofensis]|uniref:Malto-oligosyltrehalose trehalohydrolase n=2 Tax=Pedobacter westerhofensis TaxID=425512 RepID=A0A521C6W7_9SPHI|nr:maltooligosyl trehalose hydrolase [Pedobacter westerhofensis]
MSRELKRKIGVNFNDAGLAEIRFWSPEAETVELKTEAVTVALEKKELGYWELSGAGIYPGNTYQFLINGETLIPDPASLSQPQGVHGPSEAVDLSAFSWTDQDWKNPELGDYIFYELHTGTFTPEGTFEGIIAKLDYLVELGITAIEIMPVAQFPGGRNWGYDGVFPFAVQNSYGAAAGLQQLVDASHAKGLAVVLDVVYNHMGPEGNYFEQAGPYFTEKYHTPWGSAINFDDAWSDGVRRYFIENVLMWFRDFHIDGLRLDAVHAIKDLGVKHLLQEISEEVDQLIEATHRKHHLIAECDLNDNKYINSPDQHGYGMDAQWIDEFHHALRVTAGEPATGYYSDFSGIKDLEKSYRDAYIYDGVYSPHRLKTFGGTAEGNAGSQFVVFSQNHDQVGNRMLGERSSTLVSYEMQKLMAGAVICSPFLPMLFMGEEWGETNPFLFFTSHGDPELIKAVSKGRKAEFAAFHAEGEAPEPQSEDTFNQSKLQWDLLQSDGHSELLSFYKTIIGLRKKYAPLRNTNRKQLTVSADAKTNCLVLRRWEEEVQVLCLMNFSKNTQDITIPDDKPSWKKILDSADPQWKGRRAAPLSVDALQKMEIQPQSILIYTNKYA